MLFRSAVLTFAAIEPFQNNVKLGLDLKGGVLVRLEAPENATDEDMAKAIKSLEDGIGFLSGNIKKYPVNHFPEGYAYMQNHLGIAYAELSKVIDKNNNTTKAKEAFQESLGVFTEDEYPNYNRTIHEYLRTIES